MDILYERMLTLFSKRINMEYKRSAEILCYLAATSKQVEKFKVLNQQLLLVKQFYHLRSETWTKRIYITILEQTMIETTKKNELHIWTFGSFNNLNSWLKNDFEKLHSCTTASIYYIYLLSITRYYILYCFYVTPWNVNAVRILYFCIIYPHRPLS